MSIAQHDQYVLELLKDEFEAYFETALDDIIADALSKGVTVSLSDPDAYEIVDDDEDELDGVFCGFRVEESEKYSLMTLHEDVVLTVDVYVKFYSSDGKPNTGESEARYYSRAIAACFKRRAPTIANLFCPRVREQFVETPDADRSIKRGVQKVYFRYRTNAEAAEG